MRIRQWPFSRLLKLNKSKSRLWSKGWDYNLCNEWFVVFECFYELFCYKADWLRVNVCHKTIFSRKSKHYFSALKPQMWSTKVKWCRDHVWKVKQRKCYDVANYSEQATSWLLLPIHWVAMVNYWRNYQWDF